MKKIIVSLLMILGLAVFSVSAWAKSERAEAAAGNKPVVTSTARACQAREKAVTTRMSQLLALVTNMEAKFDEIAGRVQTFYKEKVLPEKTVVNYDALVAAIATKKAVVQTALDKAQADAKGFSCTESPRMLMTTYRVDMQAVKSALKEYRTSVKNLIVAVRTVAEKAEEETK